DHHCQVRQQEKRDSHHNTFQRMICLIFHPIYMNFIDFIFCVFPSSCVLSYEYRFFFSVEIITFQ
ncbi:hypothetical protein, partial [Klebsiella pneumoniae]|uniref:hypothetical protein n=1 Tax=Klebsiella pneumoniae TaxID=573 RepID=UPI003745C4FF